MPPSPTGSRRTSPPTHRCRRTKIQRNSGETRGVLGIALVDIDNDRWLDMGRGRPAQTAVPFRCPTCMTGSSTGCGWGQTGCVRCPGPIDARVQQVDSHHGLVHADLDGDGYRELTGPYEGRPKIYDNPCGANNWLEVDIVGPADNKEPTNTVAESRQLGGSPADRIHRRSRPGSRRRTSARDLQTIPARPSVG